MLNIENIKIIINKYIDNYDITNEKIKLKKEHIIRTSNLCFKIAKELKLSNEEIKIAEVIGLLHDIGRFEQIKIYNTFNDKESIDHATMGIKVLFEDKLIDKLDIDKKYYNIIKVAIINHNKNNIEGKLTEKEKLFCKIIRDADKLDIFNIMCSSEFETCFWYNNFNYIKPSFKIIIEYILFHQLNYKHIKNNIDIIIKNYALIYDFNFKYSYQYMIENKYLDILSNIINNKFNSPKVNKLTSKLLNDCNKYINKRINYGN